MTDTPLPPGQPVPGDVGTYEELNALYVEHIRAESEWLREMNRQRKHWEDTTLWFQALLEPYWEGER